MRLGRCAECEEVASLKEYEGRLLCPACRWEQRHPEEPPLY